MQQGSQFQNIMPFRGVVKALVIANVAVWFCLVVLPGLFHIGGIFEILGLVPEQVVTHFWIWQLFTYMFMHSASIFHVLWNMLTVWMFGAELEGRWGPKFFLTYYMVCGVGAGVIYLIGTTLYAYIVGNPIGMMTPLVGASGAAYGILLAYGILFGERMMLFMMLFPMKAKYFVMIMGAIQLMTMMDSGSGSQVSNLAHLGGIIVGFLFLNIVARYRSGRGSGTSSKRGRKLKLVVDNERNAKPSANSDQQGPRYWN